MSKLASACTGMPRFVKSCTVKRWENQRMVPLGKRSHPPTPQSLPWPKASAAEATKESGAGRSGRVRHWELMYRKNSSVSRLMTDSRRLEDEGSATRIQIRLVVTGTLCTSDLLSRLICRAESSLAPFVILVPGGLERKLMSSCKWEEIPAQKVGLMLMLVPSGLCRSSYTEQSHGLKAGKPCNIHCKKTKQLIQHMLRHQAMSQTFLHQGVEFHAFGFRQGKAATGKVEFPPCDSGPQLQLPP